jgi:DDE superfamily endonuclease
MKQSRHSERNAFLDSKVHSSDIVFRGMICIYLPAYSPDLNPIELAFSKIKNSVQWAGEEAQTILNTEGEDGELEALVMLFDHIYSVTEKDAVGWFKHCGYQNMD